MFFIQIIIIAQLAQWTGISYQNKAYPGWAEFLGWCLALASMLLIPAFAIVQYKKSKGYSVSEVSIDIRWVTNSSSFCSGPDSMSAYTKMFLC